MTTKLQMWVVKEKRSQKFRILPHTIKTTRQAAIKAFLDRHCSSFTTACERDLRWRWLRDHQQVCAVKVSI